MNMNMISQEIKIALTKHSWMSDHETCKFPLAKVEKVFCFFYHSHSVTSGKTPASDSNGGVQATGLLIVQHSVGDLSEK